MLTTNLLGMFEESEWSHFKREFAVMDASVYFEHCHRIKEQIKQMTDRQRQMQATEALSKIIQWFQWRTSSVEEIAREIDILEGHLKEFG